jgi:Fur family ferric uptake transcriptional regulator
MPQQAESQAMERETRQRTAIRAVVEMSERPLSALEVLEAAQEQVAGMGIATVYRNLKALSESGVLTVVSLAGANPRYEPTRQGHHHHHFMCTECERVFDIHSCPGSVLDVAPKGFTVERHELTLYGRCKDCSPGAKHSLG